MFNFIAECLYKKTFCILKTNLSLHKFKWPTQGNVKYPISVYMYMNTDKCVIFCSSLESEHLKIHFNEDLPSLLSVGCLILYSWYSKWNKKQSHQILPNQDAPRIYPQYIKSHTAYNVTTFLQQCKLMCEVNCASLNPYCLATPKVYHHYYYCLHFFQIVEN